MIEFFKALSNHAFIQNAVFAMILSGISLGVTGTFVVIKRISTISGALAHAVLGGVGIAYYLGYSPVLGAFVFAVLSAVILGLVKRKSSQQEDTVISALWAIGMSIGVIFMFITPGYKADLLTYLFGNILMISTTEIYTLIVLDIFVLLMILFFYRQFISISFDEQYSELRGIKVSLIYILLLCLIAITIILLMQVVGLILVIALLSLPASIAGMYFRNISAIMIASGLLSIIFMFSGIVVSYSPNLPAGAMIVIITGAGYLVALLINKILSSNHKIVQ
jgi:zinc transport system permease protein